MSERSGRLEQDRAHPGLRPWHGPVATSLAQLAVREARKEWGEPLERMGRPLDAGHTRKAPPVPTLFPAGPGCAGACSALGPDSTQNVHSCPQPHRSVDRLAPWPSSERSDVPRRARTHNASAGTALQAALMPAHSRARAEEAITVATSCRSARKVPGRPRTCPGTDPLMSSTWGAARLPPA